MLAIKNGKLITITDGIIENGTVLIDDGKIVAVGKDINIPNDADIIDATGKWITPGFIDAHSHISVESMPHALGELSDLNETTSPITPQIRSIDALYPEDIAIHTARRSGITASHTLPGSANICGGTGITFKHKIGKTVYELVIPNSEQMKFALGENPRNVYGSKNTMPKTRMGNAAVLRELLYNAKQYSDALLEYERDPTKTKPKFDIKLNALVPVIRRQMKARIHCHRSDDIVTAIRIAEEFDLDYALEHVTEGHIIKEFLAEKNPICTLGPLYGGPSKSELRNRSDKNAAILAQEGITICLSQDAAVGTALLPMDIGRAIAYGLSEEIAFKAVTINPAKLLGIDKRLGSLEVGKDADIAIWNGHPFSSLTRCEISIIDGIVYNNIE